MEDNQTDQAAISRACAAQAIAQIVFDGVAMGRALEGNHNDVFEKNKSCFAELVKGVVRWYWRLAHHAEQLLHKPFKPKDRDLHCLLLVGLYQLEFMRVPDYAGVSSTVDATAVIRKFWAAAVINASLRRFAANRLEYSTDALPNCSRYSHPQWMIELIRNEWPDYWEAILQANNARPQTVLRINENVCSASEYVNMLKDSGIAASADPVSPWGVRLRQPADVTKLPGFSAGWVSVQDSAAQIAVPLMQVEDGQRVLDACAAPGGKTVQILEQHPQAGEVVAVELDQDRCGRVAENLQRTKRNATVRCADATKPNTWWNGEPFDRILVDAPCSGLGVVRRHPDIKHHKRLEDIDALATRQGKFLEALWPLLRPGGKLVYVTCSLVSAENEAVVERFFNKVSDGVVEPIPEICGQSRGAGRQRIPGRHDSDGFFYARLRREKNPNRILR